jgi:hypothetical protein
MKYFTLLFLLIIGSNTLFIKQLNAQAEYNTQVYKIQKKATVNVQDIKEDLNPIIENLEAPAPGGNSYRAYLQEVKLKMQAAYPYTENATRANSGNPQLNPIIGRTSGLYQSNGNDIIGGNPTDNSMAISNDGIIVAGWNTSFWGKDIYEDTLVFKPGGILTSMSFYTFLENSGISLFFPFDPKILYDPLKDRYVICFISGRDPQDSKTVFAFSKSNNPGGEWNFYEVPGNPHNNNMWSDYPAIALTETELFYTVNLLRYNEPWQTGFEETVIWQIDKESGYRGDDSLTLRLWSGIAYNGQNLRYFPPIQAGSQPKGPNMHFISNRAIPRPTTTDTTILMNDSIFIIEITNTLAHPAVSLSVKLAKADVKYGTPPNARQSNGHVFDTNDCRVLGGFSENGEIQFVGNSIDTTTGLPGIYHGFISNLSSPNPQVKLSIIGDNQLEFGYPNIAYMGLAEHDRASLICFNHTSPSVFAGYSCMYHYHNGEYSEIIEVKAGEDYVDKIQGDYERWGDYFGIQRKYNEPGSAWAFGYYGVTGRRNAMWISELIAPGPPVTTEKHTLINQTELRIFPNPTSEIVSVEFEINSKEKLHFDVYNVQGQLVKNIIYDVINEGKNRFSFNAISLEPGTYFLKIHSASGEIASKKFIRN